MLVDANVLEGAIVGRGHVKIDAALNRGLVLLTTERQAWETQRVVILKLGLTSAQTRAEIDAVLAPIAIVTAPYYVAWEAEARARMPGNETDWPLLAAAIALDAPIWTNDRDFCGVGVVTWNRYTIHLARPET